MNPLLLLYKPKAAASFNIENIVTAIPSEKFPSH